jgi:4-alpha-glucanotransferase
VTDRPFLRALGERVGILSDYFDITGRLHETSDQTREGLLAATGLDASTESAAENALREFDHQERSRLVTPVSVQVQSDKDGPAITVWLPIGLASACSLHFELFEESGVVHHWDERISAPVDSGAIRLSLPVAVGYGYHELRISIESDPSEVHAEQILIVVPSCCAGLTGEYENRRLFGFCAYVPALRGVRNWGFGDVSDLNRLLEWAAGEGAAFVGINPLHALRNVGHDVCPYRPVSRLFRNPLYINVTAVPELEDCPEAQARMASPGFQELLARLRESPRIEFEAVSRMKRGILECLFAVFQRKHATSDTDRGKSYRRFLQDHGRSLIDFATFMAIDETVRSARPSDWRQWPGGLRDARFEDVARFRRSHAEAVEFHCFLQFELDRQIGLAAHNGRKRGIALGLYGDLALGSAPNGSDVWCHPGQFAEGASIGAPPDDYAAEGQDWSIAPLIPHRLAESGYAYWTALLRNAMRHCGALRVDHAMGLVRQFWIPPGGTPADGAYVRYPGEELMGILALESTRSGTIIIGEDLGTVPAGFSDWLAKWGVLSTRMMFFEREPDGRFRPPSAYPDRALVSATTHDYVPLAGFWKGSDLDLRRSLGLIPTDDALCDAKARRNLDRQRLWEALQPYLASQHGHSLDEVPFTELCAAVHAFLAATPAKLLAVMLDDVAGETEPINLPGVKPSTHPNWTRKMSLALESILSDAAVVRTLTAILLHL